MNQPNAVIGPFRERDTVTLAAVVEDNSIPPIPIPGSALDAVTLTLYSEHDLAIINGRDDADIKATINEAGRMRLTFTSDDMAIQNPTLPTEYHRALIAWTWNTTKRGTAEIQIIVRNAEFIPG